MKDLYKILSGKIFVEMNGSIITVGPFTFENLYLAELYAEKAYQQAIEEGCLTEDESLDILIENGWWSLDEEAELDKIPKIIEQMKLDYYNQFHSATTKDYIKYNIQHQKNIFLSLCEKKYQLIGFTCENARDQAKNYFLLENYSYINNQLLNFSQYSLQKLVSKYTKELLSDDEIREIAKSSDFRCLWSANKDLILAPPTSVMKVALINWARVYDSVYESTECPHDDIIQDNLALDGWFIFRRKKREEERKKNANESKISDKMKNAGEIFLPYKNKQDLQSIYDMNDLSGKHKLAALEKDLQKNSSIDDQKLSSNKLEIGMAKNRIAKEVINAKH